MAKARADRLLVERGLAASRSQAQALIMAGQVSTADRRIDKAGEQLDVDAPLHVKGGRRFVSRGGDKLDHALDHFDAVTVKDRVCLDIGASTGGFTDCLLIRGAAKVYAVDVGYGQLHDKLRGDERVVVRERTNARDLQREDFADTISLTVVDASFIGLGKLVDAIQRVMPAGDLIALVKPQFEVGREAAAKTRGVVRDERLRQRAIGEVSDTLAAAGFELMGSVDSPIRGPKGNLEHFLHARVSPTAAPR